MSEIATSSVTAGRASEHTIGPYIFRPPLLACQPLCRCPRTPLNLRPEPTASAELCQGQAGASAVPGSSWLAARPCCTELGPAHPLLLVCWSRGCQWDPPLPGALLCWPYSGGWGWCSFWSVATRGCSLSSLRELPPDQC